MTVLLIPPNCAEVAKLVSKQVGKFATSAVRIRQTEDGYRVEATNLKLLGIVDGLGLEEVELDDAPNGATEALVPAKEWAKHVKAATQEAKVQLAETVTTIRTPTGQTVLQNVDGRYPPLDDCLPREPPAAEFWVDAKLFVELLSVAGKFSEEGNKVVVRFWHKDKAIAVTSANANQQFFGIIMPLG